MTRKYLIFSALFFASLLPSARSMAQTLIGPQETTPAVAQTAAADSPLIQSAAYNKWANQGVAPNDSTDNPATETLTANTSEGTSGGSKPTRLPDFNDDVYYKNKLEFSLETGALFINTPFVFDVFVGGDYSHNPLHYTLVPIFPSLRWQMGGVHGPWILRGNTDLAITFSLTTIPRGPEKVYGAFDLGFRRNFIHRNWKIAPYFETRCGAGFIDAKEPDGYIHAQGQDFTFTLMLGTGVRYNIDGRWSAELGGTYMHVSNAYLSEPKYDDNGINVVGPWVGFNMRLGKAKPH